MVLTKRGDVIVSDGDGGGVYRLALGGAALERLDHGEFISPQSERLIATQNGTSPERVVTFAMDTARQQVVSEKIIERATPTLGDPTHGVVVGEDFYYIANAGWDVIDEHGALKAGAALPTSHVMRAALSKR
jgi:hypothetical protein